MEERMDNKCQIMFYCTSKQCVLSTTGDCKYYVEGGCTSSVAKANRMVLELKKLGLADVGDN